MDEHTTHRNAVEILQELGLKEYESKSFVALSRLAEGTAKDISEFSDVPRTRVYDAVRVLESKGLVEIQRSNPQRFRAVPLEEAVDTLKDEYVERAETLRQSLQSLEPISPDEETELTSEVWSLSGSQAIESRTRQLIDNAEREIVLVIGTDQIVTDDLLDRLHGAIDQDVEVIIGAGSDAIRRTISDELPGSDAFLSDIPWMSRSTLPEDETEISRLLLVDRETILVSTYHENEGGTPHHELAVYGTGFDNGLVAIVRRILVTGMLGGIVSEDD